MITREQALVKKIRDWTGDSLIGDDCAVLPGGGLVSSDALVEGTHFRLDWTDWRRLGWKSCAVNLSDIAAMAGRPRYLTVALTLPEKRADLGDDFLERKLREFYDGFLACAGRYRARLAGGDLTVGREIVIAITVFGEAHENGILLRSGARPGDVVVASGNFGGSAAGLALLGAGEGGGSSGLRLLPGYEQTALASHLEPQPRIQEAWSLVELIGSRGALMDTSDGLADALCQIAEQSGLAINLDLQAVPVSQSTLAVAAALGRDPLHWALYGGEDYELVATMSAEDWERGGATLPFTKIGLVTEGEAGSVRLFEGNRPSERFCGVLDLNNCFKHFC